MEFRFLEPSHKNICNALHYIMDFTFTLIQAWDYVQALKLKFIT